MKKLTFCLLALAMAASTVFTSCGDDDDDDNENKVMELSATVLDGTKFSTILAGFYQSAGSEKTGTSVLGKIFSSSNNTYTTIAGTSNGKQLAISINGTATGDYDLSVASDNDINNALIDLLSGKSAKEIVAEKVKTNVMIIYRESGAKEGDASYYFATDAHVHVDFNLGFYSTGTFTAKMRNSKGDKTFEITDGKFNVFGKPIMGSKN